MKALCFQIWFSTPICHKNSKSSQISVSQINVLPLSENSVAIDVVQESLHKLLKVRYVERCPAPEPVVSPPVEQDTKKRGAKSKVNLIHVNFCISYCL